MELLLNCVFGNLVKIDVQGFQNFFGDLGFQFLCKLIRSASHFNAACVVCVGAPAEECLAL